MKLPVKERPSTPQPAPRASTRPEFAPPVSTRPMANLVPYLHYGAEKLGGTGVVGLALAAFAAVFFVSTNVPLRQQIATQGAQLESARNAGRTSAAPETDASPAGQARRFVSSLPGRNDVPAIMASVVAVAAASGIELEQGSYDYVATDDDRIARYEMLLPVNGSYPQIRAFVENVLAREPSVSLDRLRIERGSVSDQVVAAELQFSILLGDAL